VTDSDRHRRLDAAAAAMAAADEPMLDAWQGETDQWEVTVHHDEQAFLDHLDREADHSH
jgi:hypothetical protein